MDSPHFGIVMATYGRPNGTSPSNLQKSLQTVINQTYNHWTMIVVSDKYEPFDELQKIIDHFNTISNGKFILLQNENVERDHIKNKYKLWRVAGANSMNVGLQYLRDHKFKYYAHLDDDDSWTDNHLASLAIPYTKYMNCVFANTQSTFLSSYLPAHTIELAPNNYPPTPRGMIHSAFSFRCDLFKGIYKTSFNENDSFFNEEFFYADADMLHNLSQFLKRNPLFCSVYVATLTCYHETEGSSLR